MSVLPSGDDSAFGVASVQASVRNLEKVSDMSPAEMSKRARTLKGYAEDVVLCCGPKQNPEAFRRCQVAAKPACAGLLRLAQCGANPEICIVAMSALACICFDNLENASVIVTSDLFTPSLSRALEPILEIRQQEQVLAGLQLLQALCAVAPEAPQLVPLMPCVVELLTGAVQEGHAPCSAVRMTALEVLVSCSLSRHRRLQLVSLLPESVLMMVLTDAKNNPSTMLFPMGLLLANLSDLSDAFQPGTSSVNSFKSISQGFWEQTGFFNDLQACLSATLQSQAWPPQSGVYHTSWKLANTYLRLARTGICDELRNAVVLLAALVEERADNSKILGCGESRAARLAVQVLQSMATDSVSLSQMKQAQKLPAALANMKQEEPASQDLLDRLTKGNPNTTHGSEDQCRYTSTVAKPW